MVRRLFLSRASGWKVVGMWFRLGAERSNVVFRLLLAIALGLKTSQNARFPETHQKERFRANVG